MNTDTTDTPDTQQWQDWCKEVRTWSDGIIRNQLLLNARNLQVALARDNAEVVMQITYCNHFLHQVLAERAQKQHA